MKETIKPFFPFILAVLCSLFAVYTLFASIGYIGSAFGTYSQKNNTTSVAKDLFASQKEPIPTLYYAKKTLLVGKELPLSSLFLLTDSNGNHKPLSETPSVALYLTDVSSSSGDSVLTILSSEDIAALEEIPSAAIYDKEQQFLYFHNSGVYTLKLHFYYDTGPGILYECQVPVETR